MHDLFFCMTLADGKAAPAGAAQAGPNKVLIGAVTGGCAALLMAALVLLLLWRRRRAVRSSATMQSEASKGSEVEKCMTAEGAARHLSLPQPPSGNMRLQVGPGLPAALARSSLDEMSGCAHKEYKAYPSPQTGAANTATPHFHSMVFIRQQSSGLNFSAQVPHSPTHCCALTNQVLGFRVHSWPHCLVFVWQESDVTIVMDAAGNPRMLGEGAFGQARAHPLSHGVLVRAVALAHARSTALVSQLQLLSLLEIFPAVSSGLEGAVRRVQRTRLPSLVWELHDSLGETGAGAVARKQCSCCPAVRDALTP